MVHANTWMNVLDEKHECPIHTHGALGKRNGKAETTAHPYDSECHYRGGMSRGMIQPPNPERAMVKGHVTWRSRREI